MRKKLVVRISVNPVLQYCFEVASKNDARGENSFVADFLKVHSQSILDFCPNKYVSSFLLKLKDICTFIFAFMYRCFAISYTGVMTV